MDTMSETLKALAEKLDQIEAQMRRIGYWADTPPNLLADYDNGTRRTYLDAPSFELWLQCVFLARAREALRTGALPPQSTVGSMAMRQYDYHSVVPEAQTLLQLLNEFDQLINQRNR
jgi:uncharacterized protein YqcC (DUF446 family)